MQIRICALFNRRVTTQWSEKEIRAYRKLGSIPEQDISEMEKWYSRTDVDWRRKDVQTLLNNWQGELDRARNYKPSQNTKPNPRNFGFPPGAEERNKLRIEKAARMQRELMAGVDARNRVATQVAQPECDVSGDPSNGDKH